MHLSQEKVESLKELSKSPGIYEALASAIGSIILVFHFTSNINFC